MLKVRLSGSNIVMVKIRNIGAKNLIISWNVSQGYNCIKARLKNSHFALYLKTAYREAMEKKTDNRVECSFDQPPSEGKVCVINIDKFDQCVHKHNFSYTKGKPCVFLKLNKVRHIRKISIYFINITFFV